MLGESFTEALGGLWEVSRNCLAKALQRLWEGFGRYPVIAWPGFTEALGKLWEVSRNCLAKAPQRLWEAWLRLYRGFGRALGGIP